MTGFAVVDSRPRFARFGGSGRVAVRCAGVAAVLLAVAAPAPGEAQSAEVRERLERCEARGPRVGGQVRERYCEARPHTLAPGREVAIAAGPVGDIEVVGEDRSDVAVLAIVSAYASTAEEAREISSRVRVHVDGSRVSVSGPRTERWTGWAVSFLVRAPAGTPFDLATNVGGITLVDVEGRIRFRTNTGDVSLRGVAGDVRGRTRTGNVDVRLAGGSWRGAGLEVESDVGDVTIHVPASYSADLDVGSERGDFLSDVPIPVKGSIGRSITGRLGDGGPVLRIRTRIGDVHVRSGVRDPAVGGR